MEKIGQEFKKFALSKGISSLDLHNYDARALTPYILEEREMRVTQMDIFSRLLLDRILWVSGVVDQHMADIVQAQLLFLDSIDKKQEIKLYISSVGGSVMNGLGIVDVMKYISCDVATINLGMAASMGSILLSSGTKGKRSSLINSRVMIHQLSSGQSGLIEDTRIQQLESEKYNYILFNILAENCGKTFQEVLEAARRDHWFNSDESLEFGLIDEIIGLSETSMSISKRLEGFDEYYVKEVMGKTPLLKK